MHGLKYSKLIGSWYENRNFFYRFPNIYLILCNLYIGDGDSSVTKRLHEVIQYGLRLLIEKINCQNHILRNNGQKLIGITKKTIYPCYLHKLINQTILRFRTAVTKAVKYRNELNVSLYGKIEGKLYHIKY